VDLRGVLVVMALEGRHEAGDVAARLELDRLVALTALSAPLVATAGTTALAPLWLLAGGAGMLLTRRDYRRRARNRLTGRRRRSWAVAVAMFVGCMAVGATSRAISPGWRTPSICASTR